MATQLKRKAAEKNRAKVEGLASTPTTLEERIDRYGQLQEEVEKLNAKAEEKVKDIYAEIVEKQNAMSDLRKQIEDEATTDLANESKTTVVGKFFAATIGACRSSRKVKNMRRVFELVEAAKEGAFFELCSFPLRNVDDYLTKPQRAEVLDESQDGPRSFKVEAR